jgi:replicative DNA helicase
MDEELRLQLLRAAVRDRTFLKTCAADVDPEDFPLGEEKLVARCALEFYVTYGDPIGPMLRSSVQEAVEKNGHAKPDGKKLRELLDVIQKQLTEPVSSEALKDRVKKLKQHKFYSTAMDEILAADQAGQFNAEMLASIVERAQHVLADGPRATDYFLPEELKKRIARRTEAMKHKHFPSINIRPLERQIKIIGRGMLGLVIAPYGTGKSMLLIHIAAAYAALGLNVLFFTLEDPKEEVEDRMDAAATGILIQNLAKVPIKLKNKFKNWLKAITGRIKIVDGTGGGISVSKMEQTWRREKQEGFTADAVIVDYDDEIECEKQFKGESARRFEFAEIYRRLRKMAVNTDTILWTASQAGRQAEGKMIVTGKDIAEDISKARKCFFAVAIGTDKDEPDKKYLNVVKHKMDKSKFWVEIYSSYDRGLFYDHEKTQAAEKKKKEIIQQIQQLL